MTTCIGPCVEHAISRSREILGYGVTMDDIESFAQSILQHKAWPTSHPRGQVVPTEQARPGDLLVFRSNTGGGHLAVLDQHGEVEDYRMACSSVVRTPIRRVSRLIVQVWRVNP